MPHAVVDALDLARPALAALRDRGEEVADEWQYVTDLDASWRERLEAVAADRGEDPLTASTLAAVERACDEAALITDPHRAIDWLSTFPQLVLFALDEPG